MSNLKQIDNPSINIKVKLLVTLGENNIYLLSQNANQPSNITTFISQKYILLHNFNIQNKTCLSTIAA